MAIKKLEDGRYEVDIRPTGRNGKRIRRKFNKKHEALAFEKYAVVNYHEKEWLSKPKDSRSLTELIELWWKYHGKIVDHGQSYRYKLNKLNRVMGSPAAFQIDNKRIARYRVEQLSEGNKASTINRDLVVLSGMFSFLIESGLFHSDHPLRGITKLKEGQTAMGFLSQSEIGQLLNTLDGDNYKIALLCLSTGARWGEAINLRVEHVINGKVTFVQTKTGSKRTVPVSADVAEEVFSRNSGFMFPDANYKDFRILLKSMKTDLPHGQATHVLRHTFATHFMMNGGNIVTLQRILGHTKINQTMTYAHFSPDYLNDAISFNPLKGKLR
ncbi:tyrosine-type recombinase/integrase [Rouxiella silvae]|uniref:Tyrosine-type recombinase/integrase n=1 Tax=Rouxiella silvae TaxID=1646373 RepID=A0AA40WYW8_9GAMM|nr:tyrosine-type recombinase/integrase [Rouxiella silvae]MBF6635587.1 tyrosine-type recombinase/integrase [Rouxiella silvae]